MLVEFLVGAAELDIRFERDRVVALRQRVQELVHGDGLTFAVALGEIVAFEHAGDGVLRGEADHAVGAQRGEPLRIERDFGLVAIENEEYLVGVGLGVCRQLVRGHGRPRQVATGGVADHAGEVADQKNDVMAEILQLPQLVELNGVSQMEVGSSGVEAFLDAQRLAPRELRDKLGFDDQLVGAAHEYGELVGDVGIHEWVLLLQSAATHG